MTVRLRVLACAIAWTCSAAIWAQTPPAQRATLVTGAQARVLAGVSKVFDTAILHQVDIVIAPADANQLVRRTAVRQRCQVTFDGIVLKDVGIRQAGGIYHPYVPIQNKPSLSLEFDEFTDGQKLHGLEKLILKNELQDLSLVNEHLAYEVFRRAGVPAPLTAYGHVTVNGIDDGIYLLREPIGRDFLVRNFGNGADRGNVYEIENMRDFVNEPSYPALKDEGKHGHARGDLVRFAAAIRSTSGSSFDKDLAPYLDVDAFVTYIGGEIATRHWDGLTYRNNNTYVYARPSDGRFVFLPYGTDQAMGGPSMTGWLGDGQPVSYLVRRMFSSPALVARVREEAARISREPVWNQKVLSDRLARVAAVLATAPRSGRTGADVTQFERQRATMDSLIRAGGATTVR